LDHFWPLLKQASFLEAAGAVAEIVSSLKPNEMTKFSLSKSVKRSVENVMSFISPAYWLFLLKLSANKSNWVLIWISFPFTLDAFFGKWVSSIPGTPQFLSTHIFAFFAFQNNENMFDMTTSETLQNKIHRRFLIICICNNIPIILNFSVKIAGTSNC